MPDTYTPIVWKKDSGLSPEERRIVDIQRKDLWNHGVRREPLLTEMAFAFAALLCGSKTRSAPPPVDDAR